jgi:thiamine-monophosphate kinase
MTHGARRRDEFERIADFFAPLAAGWPGARGLADDAAIIEPPPDRDLVVTADALVGGVHFLGDESPDVIAAKLVRVNLSDLAAMGARPLAYVVTLALPDHIDDRWLARFAAGLAAEQARFDISLIGGDSVATTGPVCLSLTAFGLVPQGRAVRRTGARPGDLVFVSGTLGDGALGLRARRGELVELEASHRAALIERYRLPQPRVALGQRLVDLAHAGQDVSDGLVADLGHICAASNVAGVVEAGRLPLSPAAQAVPSQWALDAALGGGDDYELVFTIGAGERDRVAELSRALALPLTEIGRVEAGCGITVVDRDGHEIPVARPGYRHV